MDRTRQKIKKDTEDLYNTINQADMTNMGTTFHPITKYMHSSLVYMVHGSGQKMY